MAGKNAKRVLRISKETQPYRTELTPVSFLRRSAYVFPDKIAVVHGDRRYTYRQFEERANRLASGLRAAGLRHLDRVAFICPNTPAMLEAHFGVPAAGLVLVPINTRLTSDEIGYILKHSGAKALFVDQEFEPLVKPLDLQGVKVVRVDDTGAPGDPYEDFLAAASPEPGEPWLEDEYETISINYTSGTTGRPKGVMVHHRGAYLNALGEGIETGMTFDTKYLWTLPMFHCNGWCFTWTVTAMSGTHVCLRRVEPSRIWELIDREGITHYCGAPTVQIGIVNDPKAHKLARPVTCAVAGAPPSPTLLGRLRELGGDEGTPSLVDHEPAGPAERLGQVVPLVAPELDLVREVHEVVAAELKDDVARQAGRLQGPRLLRTRGPRCAGRRRGNHRGHDYIRRRRMRGSEIARAV